MTNVRFEWTQCSTRKTVSFGCHRVFAIPRAHEQDRIEGGEMRADMAVGVHLLVWLTLRDRTAAAIEVSAHLGQPAIRKARRRYGEGEDR